MCFMPTMDEFRDFPKFIEYMEQQGAQRCGVAKVRHVAASACVYVKLFLAAYKRQQSKYERCKCQLIDH